MKMRHQASPGNHTGSSYVPQDQRLHLRLQVDEQTERVFWFHKVHVVGLTLWSPGSLTLLSQTTVTGKVLDCMASHVGMSSSASVVRVIDFYCYW